MPTPSGRPARSTRPRPSIATRWPHARAVARPARSGPGAGLAQPARRGDERRRRRRSRKRRATPRSTTPSAPIFERMRRYEQAAAAYTNYINLLPNKDRSEKAAWSRSQVRFLKSFGEREPICARRAGGRAAPHRRLPARRRQGHRQGAGQQPEPAGLRARHRLRADDDLAPDRVVRGRASDHLHAQRRRRRGRPARPAARAARLVRDRHAEAVQRPGDDQGAGAARAAEARDRELLAAGAGHVDDHRLRHAQADDGPAAAGRAGARFACRCATTACRW